jgi:hypothetical protein
MATGTHNSFDSGPTGMMSDHLTTPNFKVRIKDDWYEGFQDSQVLGFVSITLADGRSAGRFIPARTWTRIIPVNPPEPAHHNVVRVQIDEIVRFTTICDVCGNWRAFDAQADADVWARQHETYHNSMRSS